MPVLVIVGHGSHRNPNSAKPIFAHADRLRAANLFDEVREAFWKEEPALREVLRTIESQVVYVVPAFMSDGYFTEQVVPRELRLADGWELDVEKDVHYTPPVGTHDATTDVIEERAENVTGKTDFSDVGLAVVGHGTERNENSAKSTRYHAERIRKRGRFAGVRALFLDEAPNVGGLTSHFESEDVVLVPLFLSNGYHTQEDIPEDVGLTSDHREGWELPTRVDDHRVWYAGAVGTEPLLARVIAERAADAGADVDPRAVTIETDRPDYVSNWRPFAADLDVSEAGRAFLRWLERANEYEIPERNDALRNGLTRTWGQLAITVSLAGGSRRYDLRHETDDGADVDELDRHDDPLDARTIAKFDDRGRYRPLKTAPSLATGWVFPDLSGEELLAAVDFLYPVTVENWHLERNADLDVTHWSETAARQTGIYDVVEELGEQAVAWAAEACCVDSQCLKRRRWAYDDGNEIAVPRGEGEFPCREPCSLMIAAAREWTRLEREESETYEFRLTPTENEQSVDPVDDES